MNALLALSCLLVISALGAGVGVVASDPDGVGEVPYTLPPGIPASIATPGVVLTSSSHSRAAQDIVYAMSRDGQPLGVAEIARDGTFVLHTPPMRRAYLSVPGTALADVPFEPGTPLVLVAPGR